MTILSPLLRLLLQKVKELEKAGLDAVDKAISDADASLKVIAAAAKDSGSDAETLRNGLASLESAKWAESLEAIRGSLGPLADAADASFAKTLTKRQASLKSLQEATVATQERLRKVG